MPLSYLRASVFLPASLLPLSGFFLAGALANASCTLPDELVDFAVVLPLVDLLFSDMMKLLICPFFEL
jgi:hypothetical protein